MKNPAVDGTGISPWEAQVLIDTIEEVYFNDSELGGFRTRQVLLKNLTLISTYLINC